MASASCPALGGAGTVVSLVGPMLQKAKVNIRGIVQGVGFRPFVFKVARRHGISGHVLNDSTGVHIEAIAHAEAIERFLKDLKDKTPPQAAIHSMQVRLEEIPASEAAACRAGTRARGAQRAARRDVPASTFVIRKSRRKRLRFVPISPDIATCPECLEELFDEGNFRFGYPFINCTNCGPRFTIIRDIPYDRDKTTMRPFKMCQRCAAEYQDFTNRRFHAQPNACKSCGPKVFLLDNRGVAVACDDPIDKCVELLREGRVVAIKGLGGFHLACDATNDAAVSALRERKYREDKPFAVMMRTVHDVRRHCRVSETDRGLLTSPRRPIVLMRKRRDSLISGAVAPNQKRFGVMLPYTPLHHLILERSRVPLVMTSGNISDEPISYLDEEALRRLRRVADYFLVHNREIHMRCDDSVTATFRGKEFIIRRSRGYVPEPLILPFSSKRHILACGAELKNTFCLARENYFFVSHHIGDLENVETLRSFEEGIEHFKKLFFIVPQVIAYDLHPEYLSTKYALSLLKAHRKRTPRTQSKNLSCPVSAWSALSAVRVGVQHHYAHVLSCMADNSLSPFVGDGQPRKVIGVAFDGIGYGDDGAIWGGEFLVADYFGYRRAAHLDYVTMPGGEMAIKEPWRMAASFLRATYGDGFLDLDIEFTKRMNRSSWAVIQKAIDRNVNCFQTSSMGRLFDAISSLVGVRDRIHYEGQAAVELEYFADETCREAYCFDVRKQGDTYIIDWQGVFQEVLRDLVAGERQRAAARLKTKTTISSKFHNAVAEMVSDVCRRIRDDSGIDEVALSGGVFQNVYLIGKTVPLLERDGFRVHLHHRVPTNDGGISLGQAAFASLND